MIKLSIQALVNLLRDGHLTNTQIGKMMGVTPHQVYLYKAGKTKQPSATICMNIYRNIEIEGKQVLISMYNSYEELERHYKAEND